MITRNDIRTVPWISSVRTSNVVDFELLPYMRFGMGKYDMLGRIYELRGFRAAHRGIAAASAGHHRRSVRPQR